MPNHWIGSLSLLIQQAECLGNISTSKSCLSHQNVKKGAVVEWFGIVFIVAHHFIASLQCNIQIIDIEFFHAGLRRELDLGRKLRRRRLTAASQA